MESKNIAVSLAKCQAEFPKIDLDATVKVTSKKTGATYKFKYATLANILNHCLPILLANGICLTQTFKGDFLLTTLLDKSGEKLTSKMPINLNGGTMQEIGSRISYLKRYSISAMLGIVGEEDDDGNVADGNKIEKKKSHKKMPPPEKQVTDNFKYLSEVSKLKKIIETKDGNTNWYYEHLHSKGFGHANEIIQREDQKAFYNELKKYCETVQDDVPY